MLDLLLIDDDPAVTPVQVRQVFAEPVWRVRVASSGNDGIEEARRQRPDVVLLDFRLPDQSGLEVFERLRALDARIPVIFITIAKSADTAIQAMKRGAFEYLSKPLDLEKLRQVVNDAVDVVRLQAPVVFAPDTASDDAHDALCGGCPTMLEVFKAIGRVAAQDVTVLITGESGTGKELVARAIYQHSERSRGPFLALNCAAIPEHLIESELFGHEKGAFTGADRRRIGKFEQCSGGTLFLDEVGDIPPAIQSKLLRLIQERTFERVGGSETIKADVRLLAATHRDLRAGVDSDVFRADLYYRLCVFNIELPPLRERGDDLLMLVEHCLRRYNRELGRELRTVAPEALARLKAHQWPGNVRELQNVLKKALLNASGSVLLPAFLPALGGRPPGALSFDLDSFVREKLVPGALDVYADTHAQVDRLLLTRALQFSGGNYRQAAHTLGISRQTLRMKLRALGLHVARSFEIDEEDPN